MAGNQPYAVVIVTFNHAATLPACLAAVAGLDPAPESVVVIDNASEDQSAEIAASSLHGIEAEIIREQHNTGFAAAVNRGIRITETPWVLLLNPDCAPRSTMIKSCFDALAKCPETSRVGALTPKLLRTTDSDLEESRILDAAGMVMTRSGRHFDRGAGQPDGVAFDVPGWVFGGTGAAALYRRDALDDIAYPDSEYFAETFFAYREDAELAWRLQLRRWRCLYVPQSVAAHRRGFRPEEGRRGHRDINRWSVRNRFLLRAHCADLGWHLRCLPDWLIRDLLVIGACLTVERQSLPGLIDLWRLRGDAREKRRWALGRRTASARHMAPWFRRNGWIEEVETP